jgi:hypothetical protein
MNRCVWWTKKTTNLYNPPHRCLAETDLVKVSSKLMCRAHRIEYQKTGVVRKKP